MAQAPVCHVSVDEVLTQPGGRNLAYIPPANDLKSALKAIEALRQNLLVLTGQLAAHPAARTLAPQPSPTTPGKITFVGGVRASNSKTGTGEGRWVQAERVTKKVKVFNPDDHSQFVEVLRTERLVMRDTVTGEQWIFNNNAGDSGNSGSGDL